MRGGLLVLAAALALAGETGAAAPPDEGTARRIVGAGSCAMPAWAPDGGRLLFHARRKDDQQKGFATRNVWSVGADGSGEKKLTGGTKDEYHASLSPDGKKLLFVSELNGSRDIWLADADGQNPVPLTDDPGTEDQPAWSPDGRQIAYAAFPKEGGSFDIWLVNADGSGRRRLTTTPANELFPAWHPDGAHLVYVTDASGNFDLYQIDVRDGRTTPLVVSADHEARPAFSPDGTKLRSADIVRGTVEETTFKVRAAYGALVLPRAAVASILFGSGERGLARVVLANGDTVTGFLENEGIAIAAGGRTQRLAVEQIEQLSLRAGRAPAGDASFRAVMRNGDSLLVSGAFGPLRLKVGNRPTDLDAKQVDRVEFADGGEKATAVLVNGDSLTGQLGGGRVELVLAAGARVAVHPSTIRALVRAAVRPASMAGS